MAKQSKKPADLNRLATAIVKDATESSKTKVPARPSKTADKSKRP